MISLNLTGLSEAVVRFRGTPDRARVSVQRALLRIVITLQRYIILNKLQGQVLHQRTGNLIRNVVYTEPEVDGGQISATVGVAKGAPYGELQERGGTVNVAEHFSRSRLGKQFSVRAHVAHYRARPFVSTSLLENEAMIEETLTKAVEAAL